MTPVFLDTDTAELLMGVAIAFAVIFCAGVSARHRLALWLVPLALVYALVVGRVWWHWDEFGFVILLTANLIIAGLAGFLVFRFNDRTRPYALWLGAANLLITPDIVFIFDRMGTDGRMIQERGSWAVMIYIAMLAGIAVLRILARIVPTLIAWSRTVSYERPEPAKASPSAEQAQIMSMLRESKVSAEEAAQLLEALGEPPPPPADRLPLTPGIRASIIGGLLVTVGFVLPWAFIKVNMPVFGQVTGHQAGYNLRLGWLLLGLGVLPAILACIPALDTRLRQGLLRLVLAAIGLALAAMLCLSQPANVGIWTCAAGFALQLVTALGQAGLVGSSSPESIPT